MSATSESPGTGRDSQPRCQSASLFCVAFARSSVTGQLCFPQQEIQAAKSKYFDVKREIEATYSNMASSIWLLDWYNTTVRWNGTNLGHFETTVQNEPVWVPVQNVTLTTINDGMNSR